MKKSIAFRKTMLALFIAFVLGSFACQAQSVATVYEYAVLIVPTNVMGKNTNNYVFMAPDGSTTIIGPKEMQNANLENGYLKTFNSGIYNSLLIINEYAAKGWEYVESAGTQVILKRRKN